MERWTANKFGLFNFWFYDEEEFQLSNGKIIFRGTNGSGKSVTTQSFIPLLLDGDKRPHRIDPFGSSARKMENYVLINENEEDRISYLYMEFVKPKSNSYITIGMGLRGRRGKQLESWYFILKDGRRINKDFKLYKYSGEKFPLTAKQLKNELGDGNIFVLSQREYMEQVNEHLFGYSDIDNYKDLLNLLIQLRSPKLSKDFKPTVIYDILKESLNTLSEDDLRSMAEAMDNMDSLNTKLEELKRSIESCNKIKTAFDSYNFSIIYNKAVNYDSKLKSVNELKSQIDNLKTDLETAIAQVTIKEEELAHIENDLAQAHVKEEALRGNRGFALRDEITRDENMLEEMQSDLVNKEKKYEEKYDLKREKELGIKDIDLKVYNKKKKYNEALQDEEFYREQLSFYHGENLKNLIEGSVEYNFKHIFDSIQEYDRLIRDGYNLFDEYERIIKELSDLQERQHKQSGIVKAKENVLKESREYLTSVKSEYIEKINIYIENLKELLISKDNKIELFKSINEINSINDCANIEDIVKHISNHIILEIKKEKINAECKKNIVIEKINKIEEEISILVNSKEVIEDEEDLAKVKEVLDNENIPYEDFYKSIDFRTGISIELRNAIEGSLNNMGILTSIIIPEEYKNKTIEVLESNTYKIIFTDLASEENNIFEYVQLEENDFNNKYSEDVKRVLKSISLVKTSNNKTFVDINNEFGIGIITGKSSNYEAKFIGIECREKFRKEKLRLLEEKKSIALEEENQINEFINLLHLREETLKEEEKEFPNTEDIKENIKIIESNINELEKQEKELQFLNEKILSVNEENKKIKADIFKATEYIKIPSNKQSYKKAMDDISEYRSVINELKDITQDIYHFNKEINQIKEYLEDIEIDLENINDEVYTLREKVKNKKNDIEGLKEAIKIYDLGELEEEYKRVTLILRDYPKKSRILSNKITEEKVNIKHDNDRLMKNEDRLKRENRILELLEEVLKREIDLNYIEELENFNFKECVNYVINNFNKFKSQGDSILSEFYNAFSTNKNEILDYHPRIEKIFVDFEQDADDIKNKILTEGVRQDIKIRLNKKDISIYNLITYLEGALEEQSILIGDKEREVFEDTLINTLSTKINAKIHRAKGWVKEIDNLMRNMDTSSGFKLYLSWRPKKAENESEINIKELTEILSTPHFMTNEQREKVSLHFKEKLKRQKRIAAKDGSVRSYQSIIKDVLDYREWFEFQLSFSKPTESKKELTDNEFFKLSGGEKAMAMYVPLFAAVNARYNAADNKECPRIISLDEAFAGVDEDNISNMFTLIEGLNLDYVLNSQVLWGTYESVKSLSIYELIRQGEDVVLPIKYYWNGKVKTMEMDI